MSSQLTVQPWVTYEALQQLLGLLKDVPAYADNATALGAGLVPGDIYQITGVGTLTVVQ